MRSFRRFVPASLLTQHGLREHRIFRRWAHLLHHRRLWAVTRKGVALGAAAGVFFAFMTPVAQIPMAVAVAVALRAHIPTAALSTLVTNPFTFAPFYYLAFKLGGWVQSALGPDAAMAAVRGAAETSASVSGWMGAAGNVVTGMVTLGVTGAILAYTLVMGGWRLRVALALRRRAQRRRKKT